MSSVSPALALQTKQYTDEGVRSSERAPLFVLQSLSPHDMNPALDESGDVNLGRGLVERIPR